MVAHACVLPPGPPSPTSVFVCEICGIEWHANESFPGDVGHWVPVAVPGPRPLDVVALSETFNERADHYTHEFDRAQALGHDYAALSFGAVALALREVSRELLAAVAP